MLFGIEDSRYFAVSRHPRFVAAAIAADVVVDNVSSHRCCCGLSNRIFKRVLFIGDFSNISSGCCVSTFNHYVR